MIKAKATTIYCNFTTGLTITAGESQIDKDGAASFANTTNLPSERGTTGVYTLALTAAEVNADRFFIQISDAGSPVFNKEYETTAEPSFAVVSDGSNSGLTFKTDLSETTNDYWKDALVLWTSGSLIHQIKKVVAYNGTTKFLTVNTAFTGTPAPGDLALLLI